MPIACRRLRAFSSGASASKKIKHSAVLWLEFVVADDFGYPSNVGGNLSSQIGEGTLQIAALLCALPP